MRPILVLTPRCSLNRWDLQESDPLPVNGRLFQANEAQTIRDCRLYLFDESGPRLSMFGIPFIEAELGWGIEGGGESAKSGRGGTGGD